MPKLFFTSDQHFHHPAILKYEPARIRATAEFMVDTYYDTTLESREDAVTRIVDSANKAITENDKEFIEKFLNYHDEMLIHNWNSEVGPDDVVIFQGDFAYCQHRCKLDTNFNKLKPEIKQNIIAIGHKLNGYRIMVMGNHDWRGMYFSGPMKGMHYVKPEIKQFWHDVGFAEVYANPQLFKGYFEVMHEPPMYISPAMARIAMFAHVHSSLLYATETDNSFCVCADRHDLKPVQYKVFNEYDPRTE